MSDESAVASASTRLRSDGLPAQQPRPSGASSLTLKGTDVMAAIVGAMAVFALAYLIVTFTHSRVTVA